MKVQLNCSREAFEKLQVMLETDSFPADFPHGILRIDSGTELTSSISASLKEDLGSIITAADELAHKGFVKKALNLLLKADDKVNQLLVPNVDAVRYHASLAKVYIDLRESAKSRISLQHAVRLAKELYKLHVESNAIANIDILGKLEREEREVLLSLFNNIGEWHHVTGNLDQAEIVHDSVFEARKKFFSMSSNDTLISLNNFAEVVRKKGNKKRAHEMHSEAYTIRLEILGESSLDALISLWNLILTNDELDNYIDASIQQRKLITLLDEKPDLCPVEKLIRKYAETRAESMLSKVGNPSQHAYFINA